MIDIKNIKARSRDTLEHRLFGYLWGTLVVCSLAYGVLVGLPSLISSVVSRLSVALGTLIGFPLFLVSLVISGPLTYGLCRIFHKVTLGEKRVDMKDLFCGFREELGESFLLGLMRSLYIFLWSLLLIVPGIVKSYSYSMAFFIQQESKDKTWRACLDESKMLTDGYKGKLFLMDLSFIGWYIVGLLCLGVGVLWVEVYHTEARAHFYEDLKKIKRGGETSDLSDSATKAAGYEFPYDFEGTDSNDNQHNVEDVFGLNEGTETNAKTSDDDDDDEVESKTMRPRDDDDD